MKRVFLFAVVLGVAAAIASIDQALPRRPMALNGPHPTLHGAIHVHSRRSDGSGTPDEIAAAAARAGLKFIILTDHADATARPMTSTYSSGVLVVDAVEISTDNGHLVALGLPKAPYPLAGEGRDVVEDVARLGGFSIAAHPGSAKPELRWTEWTAPMNAVEWLNGDSEWRDESRRSLARVATTYLFRPPEVLATMLDRPDAVLRRWDVLTGRRRVVGVAASDAHARFDLRKDATGYWAPTIRLPGYEAMFRSFSIAVPDVTFSGNAEMDGKALLDAIRGGHVYSSIDALAAPAEVTFFASRGAMPARWTAGDFVPGTGTVDLSLESNAPADARIVLFKDGSVEQTVNGSALHATVSGGSAVYRAEIQLPGAPGDPPVPWVVTNPIYVRAADPVVPPRGEATEFAAQYANGPGDGWIVERSPRSQGAMDVTRTTDGTELLMRWALGGSLSESPFAAFVMPAGPALSGYDRLLFRARADRPMRLSVQLRVPGTAAGERWQRSVYLDDTPREITVFFDDLRPRGVTTQYRPALANVRDVLFVVDTVNARPGSSGQFWIDDVRYGR